MKGHAKAVVIIARLPPQWELKWVNAIARNGRLVGDARVRIQRVVISFVDLTEPICTSHCGALRNDQRNPDGRGARILPS